MRDANISLDSKLGSLLAP